MAPNSAEAAIKVYQPAVKDDANHLRSAGMTPYTNPDTNLWAEAGIYDIA